MRTTRRGFVMFETTVAILVLSVVGFGAFKIYYIGVDYLRESSQRETAMRAISNQWEIMCAEPADRIDRFHGQSFLSETESLALRESTSRVHVEADGDLYTVTLTVSWVAPSGRRAEERIRALRSF